MKRKFKIAPYSDRWEQLANEEARSVTNIIPCKDCGYPIIKGYCCHHCGSQEPEGDSNE